MLWTLFRVENLLIFFVASSCSSSWVNWTWFFTTPISTNEASEASSERITCFHTMWSCQAKCSEEVGISFFTAYNLPLAKLLEKMPCGQPTVHVQITRIKKSHENICVYLRWVVMFALIRGQSQSRFILFAVKRKCLSSIKRKSLSGICPWPLIMHLWRLLFHALVMSGETNKIRPVLKLRKKFSSWQE